MLCPKCGHETKDTINKFCGNCGTGLYPETKIKKRNGT
jgi:NMD protein affecting ribosome stability and mRNA decay